MLLFERNSQPVSLIDGVESLLCLMIQIVLCYFFSDVGNLVGCNNSTAHVDRLSYHHASCPHVSGVSSESIHYILSDSIALLLDRSQFIRKQASYLLCLFWRQNALTYQLFHQIAGIP